MRSRLWCCLTGGHRPVPVTRHLIELHAGAPPVVVYDGDPSGTAVACVRCRTVLVP